MFRAKPIVRGLALAFGGVSGIGLMVSGAQAQQAPVQQLQKVEVTGSNIRRADAETSSPIQIITSEEMVRQGYTTVSEVLRDVTANGQGLLSQGFSRAFAGGASGVALRGLGVGATLVLIDGLRSAPYPLSDDNQRNFVDVSNIPFSAVERIEVLLDGASAIYGSDAIGGVVNIILKKSYTGTGIVVDGGSTTKGGGTAWHASLMQGFGAPTDSYNGFLALEYRHQDAITLSQRSGDWANMDFTSRGGDNLLPGARNSTIANPVLQTPYLQIPRSNTGVAANNAFLDSRCNLSLRNANLCTYEDTWSQIVPETQNINVIGRLSARFADDWEGILTASWFNSQSQSVNRQSTVPAGSFGGNTVIGIGVIPHISTPIPVYTVPASYPGNPFGVGANVRALVPDISPRTEDFDSDTTRVVGTLKGSAWGWDLNASLGYSGVDTHQTWNGYVNNYALYAALNNPTNPLRLSGGNDPSVMGVISPTVTNTVSSQLDFIQAVATRDLTQLEGGPLGLAVGTGFVYTKQNAPNPALVSTGIISGINGAYVEGSQSNVNAYFELLAPFTKTLEGDLALRYDYYNSYGGAFTPKVGAKWTPIPQVGVRGTWGQGFRAPTPAESGTSGSTFGFNSVRDPLNCPVSNPDGTPNLTSAQNVPTQCNLGIVYLQTANPDLKAEKSNNWTLGMILEPVPKWLTTFDYYSIELKNQILTAAQLSSYDPLAHVVRGIPQQVTFGNQTTGTSPAGIIQYTTVPFVNAGQTKTTGLDLSSTYNWTVQDVGRFMAGIQWSHIFSYDLTFDNVTYKLAGTHGPSTISGDTGNPKDRFQLTLQWGSGPWTATLTGNYIGSYNMTDPSVGSNTCQDGIANNNPTPFPNMNAPSSYCNASAFWYGSLNIQYQVNKQLMIQVSGVNIFNNKPPVDMATYGGTGANNSSNGANAPYNPSLHGVGAVGPSWSVGATYNF